MNYEYKEEILLDIGQEPNCNYESESNRYYNKIDELEHVYAQATKADEYEAKAKAFDDIENLVKTELTSDDLYNDARNNDYSAGMLRVYERVDYIIDGYESGEHNEL